MKKFEYKVDMQVIVWQRTELTVKAGTKVEADTQVIALIEDNPQSLDNGNENIEIGGVEYLCDTESLVDSTTKISTVQVYDEDCEFYEPNYALYTNLKNETFPSINEEFQKIVKMRESYNSQLSNMLTRILQQRNSPITFAHEDDDSDDGKDVVVSYSNHFFAENGRILSVQLHEGNIYLKVQEVQSGFVSDIKETDLQDDGLYFIINRILNPAKK